MDTTHDRTPLLLATHEGHIETVITLLEAGADVSACDDEMKNALHLAASSLRGGRKRVQELIRHGVSPEVCDSENMTPLHHAICHGSDEVASALIQHGVDINLPVQRSRRKLRASAQNNPEAQITETAPEREVETKRGLTALHAAALFGHLRMVDWLLLNGADTDAIDQHGQTPLFFTLSQSVSGCKFARDAWADSPYMIEDHVPLPSYGDPDECDEARRMVLRQRNALVTALVKQKANLNIQDEHRQTPLHVVRYCDCDQLDTVRILLEHGADPNLRDEDGATALHLAAGQGNAQCATLLAKFATTMDAVDNMGMNVLHFSARNSCLRTLRSALRLHIPISARDADGRNALHHLLSRIWHPIPVKLLFKHGADAVATDNKGQTAIHHAMQGGPFQGCSKNILRLLIRHGADINIPDPKGRNAFHLAVTSLDVRLDVLQFISDCGVNPTAVDLEGKTALHHSSIAGSVTDEVIQFFCMHGVDIDGRDSGGFTPIQYCTKRTTETAGIPHLFRENRWARSREAHLNAGAREDPTSPDIGGS